jgi:uncharacterized membrane protein YphA (DoxX/SURF4 family)
MKFTKNIGMLLLGLWLIVHGLQGLVNFNFSGLDTIMGVVAIAAGALILVGK